MTNTDLIFSEVICYSSFTMSLSFPQLKLFNIVIPLSTLGKPALMIIVVAIVTIAIRLIVAVEAPQVACFKECL